MARRKTYIDKHGTKRFVPNRVVCEVQVAATQGRKLDLNQIWIRYCGGHYTIKEMREFYQMIHYSVGGYEEIEFNLNRGINKLFKTS